MSLALLSRQWDGLPPVGHALSAEYVSGLRLVADGGSLKPQYQSYAGRDPDGFLLKGTRSAGRSGPGWQGSGSTVYLSAKNTAADPDALWEFPASTDWTAQFVIDNVGTGSGSNPGFFRGGRTFVGTTFFVNDGATRRPWVRVNGVDILRPGSGSLWTAGQTLNIIVRFKNANRVDCWWDGVVKHSATHSTSQEALQNTGAVYAALMQYTNEVTSGSLVALRVWTRYLSDDLTKALAADPWALYEPRRIWVPVSAGGGATNLVVQDSLHAHAADILVLTSEHLLTVADALHAHAADNVVLTSATALTLADALHAHAADNVVLTSATALTLADALHAHAADSPTLTTDSVLAVADSSHSHTADALIFTAQSVLAIQEALHSHTADNIVLGVTDTTNLAIADATHGHAADALILTVQSVLTIQESLHVHSVDNLVLGTTGAANLTIADAIHSHTVDSLSLTAQSVLTIQEALHAHTADSLLLETTGQVTLLIADAVHGHFVDSISLSSTHVLAISDAIHTHAADNINLSYELSLLIADSLHSHYADNLIVSGEPVLAIDDALHLHYADALTLSSATWLVIQEAMHAHHSDNVILTFGGIGTSALVTGAILVDRKFVTSIVNAQIIGRLFDRLDS